MKKLNSMPSMTKRQAEGLVRNYSSMSKKNQIKYSEVIILLALTGNITKGKLGFKRTTADANFLINARAIFNALTLDTGHFFSPAFALLALLGTQCDDFDTAIGKVKTHALGAEGTKNTAKKSLMKTLLAALAYVNELARLNEKDSVAIITSAKMIVINKTNPKKQDLAARQGSATGEVLLIAIAVRNEKGKYVKAEYEWQLSIDRGVTWENLPRTLVAKNKATDLLPGIPTIFRKRTTTTKGGTTDWSDVVEIIPQ